MTKPEERQISILRIEPDPEAEPGEDPTMVVGYDIPEQAFDDLIKVAMWVSRGKSFAFTPDPSPRIGSVYPDATARRCLGALHEAGLITSVPADTEKETTP